MNRKSFLHKTVAAFTGAALVSPQAFTQATHQSGNTLPLHGKVAFITGAARDIGRATALELSRQGASIALLDIADATGAGMAISGYKLSSSKELDESLIALKATGAKAISVRADVRNLEELKNAAKQVAGQLGGIDIVVANAGIVAWTTIEKSTEKQWKDVIDVNINGVVNTIWATLPYLKKSTSGRIITLSSISGRMGVIGNGAYSTTKWAVVGLTKSLALELGKYNITVNAVAPTAVNTPMYQSEGQRRSTNMRGSDEQDKAMLGYHSLQIPALQAEDIAQSIAFLSSEGAKFISGVVLDVAAGGNAHYTA
jgi:NAD(P)-dependent dehydrogenase (short-subunit alcohol dehydrogenase family)